jgi:hypothetical protein
MKGVEDLTCSIGAALAVGSASVCTVCEEVDEAVSVADN